MPESRVLVALPIETRPLRSDVDLLRPQYPSILFLPREGLIADDFGLNSESAMNPLAAEARAALVRAGYPVPTGYAYNPRAQLFKNDSTVSPVNLGTAFSLHVGAVVTSDAPPDAGAIARALAPVIRAKIAVPGLTDDEVRARLQVTVETPPSSTVTTFDPPAGFAPWRSSSINPSAAPLGTPDGGGGGGNGNPPTPTPPAQAPSALPWLLLGLAGVIGAGILIANAPPPRRRR